jgi:Holliday junction resolvase
MTPAGRRDKGATGEREVIKLLEDELGLKLTRNPLQSHRGGRDVIEDIEQMQKPIPFAIEVKRQEAEALAKWWSQTCLQGEKSGRIPVLFYRASRKPWNVVVEAHYVNPVIWPVRRREGIMMAVPTAIQWMREKLNGA